MGADQVTVSLPEAQRENLESIVDPDKRQEFFQLAVEQWTRFVFGRDRFRSVSELSQSWLGQLFEAEVIEAPLGQSLLVKDFNMPYGQAAYIARVLEERDIPTLRKRIRASLLKKLQTELEKAGRLGLDADVEIRLHKSERRELSILFAEAVESEQDISQPRFGSTIGDYAYWDLKKRDIMVYRDALLG